MKNSIKVINLICVFFALSCNLYSSEYNLVDVNTKVDSYSDGITPAFNLGYSYSDEDVYFEPMEENGGNFLDLDKNGQEYFIKSPSSKPLLASHIARVMLGEKIPLIKLVRKNEHQKSSRRVLGFIEECKFIQQGILKDLEVSGGAELAVILDWIALDDRNCGNVGYIKGKSGYEITNIDYDKAFYFDRFLLDEIFIYKLISNYKIEDILSAFNAVMEFPEDVIKGIFIKLGATLEERGPVFMKKERREQILNQLIERKKKIGELYRLVQENIGKYQRFYEIVHGEKISEADIVMYKDIMQSTFINVVEAGNLHAVKEFLAAGVDHKIKVNGEEEHLVHQAIRRQHAEVVEALFNAGASVGSKIFAISRDNLVGIAIAHLDYDEIDQQFKNMYNYSFYEKKIELFLRAGFDGGDILQEAFEKRHSDAQSKKVTDIAINLGIKIRHNKLDLMKMIEDSVKRNQESLESFQELEFLLGQMSKEEFNSNADKLMKLFVNYNSGDRNINYVNLVLLAECFRKHKIKVELEDHLIAYMVSRKQADVIGAWILFFNISPEEIHQRWANQGHNRYSDYVVDDLIDQALRWEKGKAHSLYHEIVLTME